MMTRRSLFHTAAAAGGLSLLPRGAFAGGSARASGFYYPEETDPHERTFMQWPVSPEVHPDADFLYDLQATIADIASTIAEFEPVVLLAAAEHHKAIRNLVSGQVELWDIPTDDLWARDSGPSFVVDGKGGLALTQFNFNGWGGKQTHDNDGKIAARVAKKLGLPVFDVGLVGEAGGVETDGHGTLIAHESSWINPNRNKGSKAEVEAMLLDAMGAEKMIWAPGIKGADDFAAAVEVSNWHIQRRDNPALPLEQLSGARSQDRR
jgi:agmatine deiminase